MLKTSTSNLLYSIEEILKNNDIPGITIVDVNAKLYGIIQNLEDKGFKEGD